MLFFSYIYLENDFLIGRVEIMVRLIYNKNSKQITNKEDDFLDAKRKKEIEQLV